MNGTYQDEVRKIMAENTKLIYQMRIKYNIDEDEVYDEFEKSKHYKKDNLIVFNRLLWQKIRLLEQEKKRQDNCMIFDGRSLDEIIDGYKDNGSRQDGIGKIKTPDAISDFTDMYKQYRKLKEKNIEYKDNTSSVLEQLKKLRRNT